MARRAKRPARRKVVRPRGTNWQPGGGDKAGEVSETDRYVHAEEGPQGLRIVREP